MGPPNHTEFTTIVYILEIHNDIKPIAGCSFEFSRIAIRYVGIDGMHSWWY